MKRVSGIMEQFRTKQRGFTIVELLIVIVVIGILAAITIVAYNGIQNRARVSSVNSALTQVVKKIAIWQVDNPGVSPTDLATLGITNSGGVIYQYTQTGAGTTYCVTASVATVSYKIDSSTASTTPVQGVCSGHTADGYIVNLHPNPGALSTGGYSNYAGLSPNASSLSTVAAGWASSGSASRATWSVGGDPTQGDLGIYTNSNSALTSGRTYTLRYRINAGQNATVAGPGIWANSGIFSITASSAGTTSFIANTPVTRWVTFTGDAAALGSGLRIVQHPTIAAGYYYEISDVTLYEGVYNSAINFCWGNSPGWIWNGTANNSTSTGPPL